MHIGHHEQTLHVVRSPAASSNNVPASQSGNRTSNQSTNATASNRPINAGGMMRINIGHANDLNSIFQVFDFLIQKTLVHQ